MQEFEHYRHKIDDFYCEYERVCELLNYEEVLLDKKLFLKYQSKKQQLSEIATTYKEYLNVENLQKELNQLIVDIDQKEKLIYENEIEANNDKLNALKSKLLLLVNKFDAKQQNIVVEIVADKMASSGNMINDLIEGYLNYCTKNNFDYSCSLDWNLFITYVYGKHIYRSGQNTPNSFDNLPSQNEEDSNVSISNGVLTSSYSGTSCLGTTGDVVTVAEIPIPVDNDKMNGGSL